MVTTDIDHVCYRPHVIHGARIKTLPHVTISSTMEFNEIIIIILNITSIALNSSGARARKRNKTKSLIKFKSRGHRGHHQYEGPPTI